jgi:hypothetical protein
MPIPASQLETWTHQGATTISSRAYASIRDALTSSTAPAEVRGTNIFLQGSYANTTNIYADSDIDVVVLYEGTFHKDVTALSPTQVQIHEALFSPATYHWSSLQNDVFAALRSHFGSPAVIAGRKAIKVDTGHGRMTADVVPAMQFRRYATFVDANNLTAHWGIQFFDSAGNPIVNYPKYHIDNGEKKNSALRTQGQYKPTVRLFKNLRNALIDRGIIQDNTAPSYFVECALYNVPDSLFIGDLTQTVPAIIDYLVYTPYSQFVCQNSITALIGTGPTQWREEDFATFVLAAQHAWVNW